MSDFISTESDPSLKTVESTQKIKISNLNLNAVVKFITEEQEINEYIATHQYGQIPNIHALSDDIENTDLLDPKKLKMNNGVTSSRREFLKRAKSAE